MRICACCRRQYVIGGYVTSSGRPVCSAVCAVVYDRKDDDDVGSTVFAYLNRHTHLPGSLSVIDGGLVKTEYNDDDFNIILMSKREKPLTEDEQQAVMAPGYTFQELPGVAMMRKDLVTGRKEDIGYWLVQSEDKEAVKKWCQNPGYQSWESFYKESDDER